MSSRKEVGCVSGGDIASSSSCSSRFLLKALYPDTFFTMFSFFYWMVSSFICSHRMQHAPQEMNSIHYINVNVIMELRADKIPNDHLSLVFYSYAIHRTTQAHTHAQCSCIENTYFYSFFFITWR